MPVDLRPPGTGKVGAQICDVTSNTLSDAVPIQNASRHINYIPSDLLSMYKHRSGYWSGRKRLEFRGRVRVRARVWLGARA